MCTSFERDIGTCLLQNGANREQEEAAADGRSCGRHQFDWDGTIKNHSWGEISKGTQVWS